MEEKNFAQLSHEQLEKINELEKNIGVTLIAYDISAMQQVSSKDNYNNTPEQHPS